MCCIYIFYIPHVSKILHIIIFYVSVPHCALNCYWCVTGSNHTYLAVILHESKSQLKISFLQLRSVLSIIYLSKYLHHLKSVNVSDLMFIYRTVATGV